MSRILKENIRTWTEATEHPGPHIFFKYVRHNHVCRPVMEEVFLEMQSH